MICNDVRPQASVVSRSHSEFRVSGPVLYKLDISWPKHPELFTGQVFGVAVNHVAGLVYVAQVSDTASHSSEGNGAEYRDVHVPSQLQDRKHFRIVRCHITSCKLKLAIA